MWAVSILPPFTTVKNLFTSQKDGNQWMHWPCLAWNSRLSCAGPCLVGGLTSLASCSPPALQRHSHAGASPGGRRVTTLQSATPRGCRDPASLPSPPRPRDHLLLLSPTEHSASASGHWASVLFHGSCSHMYEALPSPKTETQLLHSQFPILLLPLNLA